MTWELLDAQKFNGDHYDLYAKNKNLEANFMIRVNGIELMNSEQARSEYILGQLAIDHCQQQQGRLLIGGLGIGFTLKQILNQNKQHQKNINITVSEISPIIRDWFSEHFMQCLDIELERVDIIIDDVFNVIQENRYDVMCLDVDNGPSYLSLDHNKNLYTEAGLQIIFQHLTEQGVCLIWSAYQEADLIRLATQVGFVVEEIPVPLSDVSHFYEQYIYKLSKSPDAQQSRH